MIKVKIDVEQNEDHWQINSVFVNIDNDTIHPILSGEQYKTKEAAVAEMKRRVMKYLNEKARTETDNQIEWRLQ